MGNIRKNDKIKICLFGASFDTGNLGVSALTESSIKVILNRWPDAEVTLAGLERTDGEYHLKLWGREVRIKKMPIRFCKNIFLPNHFCVLFLYGFLSNIFQWQWLSKTLADRNPYFKALTEAAIVADITGGDSFSDIYGIRRFILGFLCKWLVIFFRKRLVLLPQTYGPFKRPLTKTLARYVLNHASLVYSRDRASMEYANSLLNTPTGNEKVRFVPDVAFILDPQKPSNVDIGSLPDIRTDKSVVVGINVSGLLYYGRYATNNVFGLKENYRRIIRRIVDFLIDKENVLILLVPHMSTPSETAEVEEIENDFAACLSIYKEFSTRYPEKIFMVRGSYNHGQIKYIIGLCDFFLGSRMHACIAALSQQIPALGLAYSKKFSGVFESVGVGNLVIDLRSETEETILAAIEESFSEREAIVQKLLQTIPEAQKAVLNTLSLSLQ